jgi:hypothetical protein
MIPKNGDWTFATVANAFFEKEEPGSTHPSPHKIGANHRVFRHPRLITTAATVAQRTILAMAPSDSPYIAH